MGFHTFTADEIAVAGDVALSALFARLPDAYARIAEDDALVTLFKKSVFVRAKALYGVVHDLFSCEELFPAFAALCISAAAHAAQWVMRSLVVPGDLSPEPRSCTVCMETLKLREPKSASAQLSCGHVFHTECICRWLVEALSCPECRRAP